MADNSQFGEPVVAAPAWETRDNFSILMQGLSNIMGAVNALNQKVDKMTTSNQDLMNAIAALPIAVLTSDLTDLDTTVKTAVSDMGTGGDAARAQILMAIQAAGTQLGTVATQIGTIKTELTTAIAAQTPPPAAPATP